MSANYVSTTKPHADDSLLLMVAKAHFATLPMLDNMRRRFATGALVDGRPVIDLNAIWNGLVEAARAIVSVNDPSRVIVVGTPLISSHPVRLFAFLTQATACISNVRSINDYNAALVIVVNTKLNQHIMQQCAEQKIPVIKFMDLCDPYDDSGIIIPCNNRSPLSMSLLLWLLAREVLRMKGSIPHNQNWNISVDNFYHCPSYQMEYANFQDN